MKDYDFYILLVILNIFKMKIKYILMLILCIGWLRCAEYEDSTDDETLSEMMEQLECKKREASERYRELFFETVRKRVSVCRVQKAWRAYKRAGVNRPPEEVMQPDIELQTLAMIRDGEIQNNGELVQFLRVSNFDCIVGALVVLGICASIYHSYWYVREQPRNQDLASHDEWSD